MAIRSRRLRKKLCVDEFQELGCELTLTYREGLDSEAVNACFRAFLAEAIEGNGLGYVGEKTTASSAWRAAARSPRSSASACSSGWKDARNWPSSSSVR